MLEHIVPPTVQTAHSLSDRADAGALLFPEEWPAVATAVSSRQAEYATVRACARDALTKLGQPPVALVPGENREPRWPAGIVGSMTHCTGYRGAAVAHDRDIAALGIDAEPNAPLPDGDGLLNVIAHREEIDLLAALPACGTAWDRLLFSAKECVYKAWFPLTGRWLGFEEAIVRISPAGTFEAQLLVEGPTLDGEVLDGFSGTWLHADGLLLTAIAVPYRRTSERGVGNEARAGPVKGPIVSTGRRRTSCRREDRRDHRLRATAGAPGRLAAVLGPADVRSDAYGPADASSVPAPSVDVVPAVRLHRRPVPG
ncbi:4'-phosphopantetheinyl transferase [Streptomyces sp. NPDC002467]|uniref:4'-phosphopantetheinyl transferase family protein n=1 Tax=Streptomyces sp. NPDC002467 TaxID=3364647 RepID=UPI0036B5F3D3